MGETSRRIDGIGALEALVGQELGTSPWFTIDQARINQFADATMDHQWIHVDVERAKRDSPFGTTIAHGYMTVSLLPHLRDQVYWVDGPSAQLNYGVGKVRFPAPVRCDARVQATFTLKSLDYRPDGSALAIVEARVDIEGEEKPACIAEMMGLLVP